MEVEMRLLLCLLMICFNSSVEAFDPTKPQLGVSQTKKKSQSKPATQPLTGIFKKGNSYMAVLEGKTYKKGDRFRGSRITKITRTYLLLSDGKGVRRLNLITKFKS